MIVLLALISCDAGRETTRSYEGTVLHWNDMRNNSYDSIRGVVTLPGDNSWLRLVVTFRKDPFTAVVYSQPDTILYTRRGRTWSHGRDSFYVDVKVKPDSLYISDGGGFGGEIYTLKIESK